MSVPKVFVDGVFATGTRVELARDDGRKMRLVLRKIDGDELAVTDSSGRRYRATLAFDGPRAYALLAEEIGAPPRARLNVTLAQGLPKGAKMDFVIEKATELGVVRIRPFSSERSAGDAVRDGKVDRWRRIAKSASEQCGRPDVPAVDEPVAFPALCAAFGSGLVLVPWELAERVPLHERLPQLLANRSDATVVIGPEGGFSEAEVGMAEAAGATPVSLGDRILRTETAGLVACTALLYASGDL